MNYRREIGHQKSPRRPDKFRLRLGLLSETSTKLLSSNGNRNVLRLEWNDPERMACIKPQQPQSFAVVYPAVREPKPGYIQVYSWPSGWVCKIAPFLPVLWDDRQRRLRAYLKSTQQLIDENTACSVAPGSSLEPALDSFLLNWAASIPLKRPISLFLNRLFQQNQPALALFKTSAP
jgi:hypothetical protein